MKESLLPIDLKDSTLLQHLYILQAGLNSEDIIKDKSLIQVENYNQAVSEFIDLVLFTSTLETKDYIIARLSKLKSIEKLLQELERYLPIEFDYTIDPSDSLPKTRYSPRLLKVAVKSLTVNNLASNFINIIDSMFNQLLYFLQYDLNIQELIYNITVELKKEIFKVDHQPMKLITLTGDYYLGGLNHII